MDRLADPKTALIDLGDCDGSVPSWLRPLADSRLEDCRDAAPRSRKRTPSVKPRPPFIGFDQMLHAVAPPVGRRRDGEQPETWGRLETFFVA